MLTSLISRLAQGYCVKERAARGARLRSSGAVAIQEDEECSSMVPGEKSDPKTILSRLAKQNRGLDTSEWRLIHRQESDKGQLLVLGMSEESLEKLRLMGGRAHLELSQVTFELPEQGQMGSL